MKASIATSFARAYKYGNETAQTPEEVFDSIIYPYNLGEFEKVIDLSRFDVTYYANDTNQEHPVYILKDEYKTQKINLNGESVSTLYTNDHKSIDYNTKEEYTDKVIGCGFGVPSGQTVPSNHTAPTDAKTDEQDVEPADRYNQVYYDQTRYTYRRNDSGMVPRMQYVYDNLFENGTIDGITPIYLSEDDSMIVPAVDTVKRKVCYYNKLGNKAYMREPTATPYFLLGALTYGGANNYSDGWSGMFELLQEVQPDPEEDTYLTFYPPVPYSGTGINYKMGYGTRTGARVSNTKTIPIFLRDKNGEYWFWNITQLPNYLDYSYPRPGTFTYHSEYVMKVKDLPAAWISNGVISATNGSWITSEQFTDIGQVDKYLDTVFNPVIGGNYDDGGSDITDAVGGDENKIDEIETDEGKWNNGLATVRGWGNYFGSYVVGKDQLAQYTGTLSMLFNSRDLFSSVFEYMGEKIQRNTMDLIMLPYPINSGIELRKFVVGNVAIANDPSDPGQWAVGNNQANANILIDPVKTDVVNLGTIDRYYDSFLDFAPYSSASLYIPYIGTVELPINIIQSTSEETKNLQLLFRIDSSTGDMVALLQVNGSTIKQWTGNCAKNVQINIEGDGQFIKQMASKVTGTVLGISTGAIGHSIASGANSIHTTFNPVKRLGALGRGLNLTNPDTKAAASLGNTIAKGQLDVSMGLAQEMMMPNSNPISTHSVGSSSVTGDVGYLGPQQVILYVERPIEWKPEGYEGLVGRPTKKIAKLGSVEGFAQVSHLHLRCAATEAEKNEITQMLNAGVIF